MINILSAMAILYGEDYVYLINRQASLPVSIDDAPELDKIYVYRIIPIEGLESNLRNGLYAKNFLPNNVKNASLGNTEIIYRRDYMRVKVHPGGVVNDYVPFYFSKRTPMLLNIKTGYNGTPKRNQADVIYLVFKLNKLINGAKWCFTDGNATKQITNHFDDLNDINQLDWRSIRTHDFGNPNSDNDTDRGRKKQSEFLIKEYVPSAKIGALVVLNDAVKRRVERIVADCGFKLKVYSDMSDLRPRSNGESKFYF